MVCVRGCIALCLCAKPSKSRHPLGGSLARNSQCDAIWSFAHGDDVSHKGTKATKQCSRARTAEIVSKRPATQAKPSRAKATCGAVGIPDDEFSAAVSGNSRGGCVATLLLRLNRHKHDGQEQ
jgi:hypothetical protein